MSSNDLPPPSSNVISLAYVEIVLSAIFLPLVGFIAWKHGKAGMACWQIYMTAFVAKLVANIYLIVNKEKPYSPTVVSNITDSGVIATISLGIIGIVYEANTILPQQAKKWNDKIILGVTHLAITGGIAAATYGGSPSATGTGVANQALSRTGNLVLLFVLLAVCGWMWPTYKKTDRYSRSGNHPNAHAARILLWAGMAAIPSWLGRLIYMCLYAFNRQDTALDPVTGSFAIKMLLFATLWTAASALTAGGWFSQAAMPAGGFLRARDGDRFDGSDDEAPLSRRRSGPDEVEMCVHVVRPKS